MSLADSVLALEQENERLRAENEYLTQTMDTWVEQRDETLKIMKDSLKEALEAKPEPTQSESVTKLLDLLEPDIERTETIIVHDERLKQVIAAFRDIRPK